MKKKKVVRAAILLFFMTVLAGCPTLTKISVKAPQNELYLGQSLQYSAIGEYHEANQTTEQDITDQVTWGTSPELVTFSDPNKKGKVTAIQIGTTQITATLSGVTGSTQLTIKNLPITSEGQVRQLLYTIRTGDDDLRGGKDNLDIILKYTDGSTQTFENVNGGSHWDNGSIHTFMISPIIPPLTYKIADMTLHITTKDGFDWSTMQSSDNWKMASLSVMAIGDNWSKEIFRSGPNSFTATKNSLTCFAFSSLPCVSR